MSFALYAWLALSASFLTPDQTLQDGCAPLGMYRITGYVRGHHSNWTADGTSVWTREPITAASYDLPFDSYVRVEGLDPTYRVADRGHLEARHLDILVDSVPEAYDLERLVGGKYAAACLVQ